MSAGNDSEAKPLNLVFLGAERAGFPVPDEPMENNEWKLLFESIETERKLDEFDGCVIPQGAFEHMRYVKTPWQHTPNYWSCDCERDLLDRRHKEVTLLRRHGGLVCCLLHSKFIDSDGQRQFRDTDLVKRLLNNTGFDRMDLRTRKPQVRVLFDEFAEFHHRYGAASTRFVRGKNSVPARPVATIDGGTSSMLVEDSEYYIGTMIPKEHEAAEFYRSLLSSVTALNRKLVDELPPWAEQYEFAGEKKLLEERSQLISQTKSINDELELLRRFKGVLAYQGDLLVDVVESVLRRLGFQVKRVEQYREDLALEDSDSRPWCLLEVKGTNKGIKREFINQADNHRERAGKGSDFPSLLIVNPLISKARAINDKNREVAREQVDHAAKNNILVLRTLDLLNLLRRYMNEDISSDEVRKLFSSNAGWLEVTESEYKIHS